MANCSDPYSFDKQLINAFRPQIHDTLKVDEVIPHLMKFDFCTKELLFEVLKSNKTDHDKIDMLLNAMTASHEEGWFQGFLDVLAMTGHNILLQIFQGNQNLSHRDFFIKIISSFLPELIKINPCELLPNFQELGCLNGNDCEDIRVLQRNNGETCAATILLMKYITRKKEDWFPCLVLTFNKNGSGHLLDIINDKLKTAKTLEQAKALTKEMIRHYLGENEANMLPDGEYSLSNKPVQVSETEQPESFRMNVEDGPVGMDLEGAPDSRHCDFVPEEKKLKIHDQNATDIMTTEAMDFSLNLSEHSERNNLSLPKGRVIPDKMIENKLLNISPNPASTTSNADNTNSAAYRIPTPPPPETLVLRDYQKELAEPAIKGENAIIVAPTGSGKTHVALAIAKAHFEGANGAGSEVEKKLVFFVPTVPLVQQQCKMFQKYLSALRILPLSGENGQPPPLSHVVDDYDIFIMTPQILINASNDGEIDPITSFSLFIFDECHHTMKDHPYNTLMKMYLDAKNDDDTILPQVVGLTASVGVGKARKTADAREHILRLCANLDAHRLHSVNKNWRELQQHVNTPDQETLQVTGRKVDPFCQQVRELMDFIERRMNEKAQAEKQLLAKEVPSFSKKMVFSSEKGSEKYTQTNSALKKEIAKIYNQDVRRFFVACRNHLEIYNNALMINADCRTKDGLAYIKKEIHEISVVHADATDNWLAGIFKEKEPLLQRVADNKNYTNPKLDGLKTVILEKMTSDSRAILFCKTREMTLALANWMMEDAKLKVYNAKHLTGANANQDQGGMTLHQQEDALKFFKDGQHKVIIATTVAEEGLDISKCDLVIRYEHVTNEQAMIQARGRARADDAKFVLVTDSSRGNVQRDHLNQIREKMMGKAIEEINDMPAEDFKKKTSEFQMEALREKQMSEQERKIAEMQKARRQNAGEFELRCFKCNAFCTYSSDFRKVKDSHHVIVDPEFFSRVIVEPHPKPKEFDDFTKMGKVFCKECKYDWGIKALYKKVPFPVLKIVSFVLIDSRGRRDTCKKWKDAPFSVQQITAEDVERQFSGQMEEENWS